MSGPPGPPGPPPDMRKDVILIFVGICAWDYLTSLWFEYKLLNREIRFRWQFVPYFFARYFALALSVLCTVQVFTDSPAQPPCIRAAIGSAALYLGLLSIVFGTWNLLTRTAIIWGYHPLLMKILFVTGLAHFALAFVSGSIGRDSCIPPQPDLVNVLLFGAATAVIEFVILLLSLIGIKRATQGESHLARILRTQGIAYFVIVLCIQILTIVVNLAHTNDLTRMWIGVSGAILCPVLSCRLVISTISQGNYGDHGSESQTRHVESFGLSESESRNASAGRITTCIDIDSTKDDDVC